MFEQTPEEVNQIIMDSIMNGTKVSCLHKKNPREFTQLHSVEITSIERVGDNEVNICLADHNDEYMILYDYYWRVA